MAVVEPLPLVAKRYRRRDPLLGRCSHSVDSAGSAPRAGMTGANRRASAAAMLELQQGAPLSVEELQKTVAFERKFQQDSWSQRRNSTDSPRAGMTGATVDAEVKQRRQQKELRSLAQSNEQLTEQLQTMTKKAAEAEERHSQTVVRLQNLDLEVAGLRNKSRSLELELFREEGRGRRSKHDLRQKLEEVTANNTNHEASLYLAKTAVAREAQLSKQYSMDKAAWESERVAVTRQLATVREERDSARLEAKHITTTQAAIQRQLDDLLVEYVSNVSVHLTCLLPMNTSALSRVHAGGTFLSSYVRSI